MNYQQLVNEVEEVARRAARAVPYTRQIALRLERRAAHTDDTAPVDRRALDELREVCRG